MAEGIKIGNIAGGLILLLASFPFLIWNEKHWAGYAKDLKIISQEVKTVNANIEDPSYNQKLIHISGQASTDETVKDPITGIQEHALKLQRLVNMYQWVEYKETKNNQETYRYIKEWRDRLVDSSHFNEAATHQNPTTFPLLTQTFFPEKTILGAFIIPQDLLDKLPAEKDLTLTSIITKAPELISINKNVSIIENAIFLGNNNAHPDIGDIKVNYKIAEVGPLSIIAQQHNNSLAKHWLKGNSYWFIESGMLSADAVVWRAYDRASTTTWLLRLMGLIMVWFGLLALISPLSKLLSFIPFFGFVVDGIIQIMLLLLALGLTLIVVSISYLIYRPLIGLIMLATSGACIFAFIKVVQLRRKRTSH